MNFGLFDRERQLQRPVLKALALGNARCSRCGTGEKRIYYSSTGLCVDCMFSEFCRLQRNAGNATDAFDEFADVVCRHMSEPNLIELLERINNCREQTSIRIRGIKTRGDEAEKTYLANLNGLFEGLIAACRRRINRF